MIVKLQIGLIVRPDLDRLEEILVAPVETFCECEGNTFALAAKDIRGQETKVKPLLRVFWALIASKVGREFPRNACPKLIDDLKAARRIGGPGRAQPRPTLKSLFGLLEPGPDAIRRLDNVFSNANGSLPAPSNFSGTVNPAVLSETAISVVIKTDTMAGFEAATVEQLNVILDAIDAKAGSVAKGHGTVQGAVDATASGRRSQTPPIVQPSHDSTDQEELPAIPDAEADEVAQARRRMNKVAIIAIAAVGLLFALSAIPPMGRDNNEKNNPVRDDSSEDAQAAEGDSARNDSSQPEAAAPDTDHTQLGQPSRDDDWLAKYREQRLVEILKLPTLAQRLEALDKLDRDIVAIRTHRDALALGLQKLEDESDDVAEVYDALRSEDPTLGLKALERRRSQLASYAKLGREQSGVVASLFAACGTAAFELNEIQKAGKLASDALEFQHDCKDALRLEFLVEMEEGRLDIEQDSYRQAWEHYKNALDNVRFAQHLNPNPEVADRDWWNDQLSNARFALGMTGPHLGEQEQLRDSIAALKHLLTPGNQTSPPTIRRHALVCIGIAQCHAFLGEPEAATAAYRSGFDALPEGKGSQDGADEEADLLQLRIVLALGWADSMVNLGLVDEATLTEAERTLDEHLHSLAQQPDVLKQQLRFEHASLHAVLAKTQFTQFQKFPTSNETEFLNRVADRLNLACGMFEQITSVNPDVSEAWLGLALTHIFFGAIANQRAELASLQTNAAGAGERPLEDLRLQHNEDAISHYKSALKILDERKPTGILARTFVDTRVRARMVVGIISASMPNKQTEATEFLAHAIRDIDDLAPSQSNVSLLQVASNAHRQCAELAFEKHPPELKLALQHANAAVKASEQADNLSPDDAVTKQELATALLVRARIYLHRTPHKAIADSANAESLLDVLRRTDVIYGHLITAINRQGRACLASDFSGDAVAHFSRAVAYAEEHFGNNNDSWSGLRIQSELLQDLSVALYIDGQFDAAIQARERCVQTRYRTRFPQTPGALDEIRDRLAEVIFAAECLRMQARFGSAKEHYSEALDLLKKLPDDDVEQSNARLFQLGVAYCESEGSLEGLLNNASGNENSLLTWKLKDLTVAKDTAQILLLADWFSQLNIPRGTGHYNRACCFGICTKLELGWPGAGSFLEEHRAAFAAQAKNSPTLQEYRRQTLSSLKNAIDAGSPDPGSAVLDWDLSAYWQDPEFLKLIADD